MAPEAPFSKVKQIRTPLATRLARVRLSPLGSARSHPVSRFDASNVLKFEVGVNHAGSRPITWLHSASHPLARPSDPELNS